MTHLIKCDEPDIINHLLTEEVIDFFDDGRTVMAHHERMKSGRAHLKDVLLASDDDTMTLNCDGQFILHDVLPVVFNLIGTRFW